MISAFSPTEEGFISNVDVVKEDVYIAIVVCWGFQDFGCVMAMFVRWWLQDGCFIAMVVHWGFQGGCVHRNQRGVGGGGGVDAWGPTTPLFVIKVTHDPLWSY